MPIKFSLLKFLRTLVEGGANNGPTNFILQDYGFRIDKLGEGINFCINESDVFPIWLCPARKLCPKEIQHLTDFTSGDLFVDVGLYG